MSKEFYTEEFLKNEFTNYLESLGYSEITPSGHKSTVYDYHKRISKICADEGLSWFQLGEKIYFFHDLYGKGGNKETLGIQSNSAVISALAKYKDFVEILNIPSTTRKFLIVDLYSGAYNIKNLGHELFNQKSNSIDGRYYGYVPDYDNPNIDKLGAHKESNFIDDILIIFVKKISQSDNNRIVTGVYPSARVHRKAILNDRLNRNFIDKDGLIKTASYSVESDSYIPADLSHPFIIKINDYNNKMFRKQRVYSGTYPKLDYQITKFVDKMIKTNYLDDDFAIQEDIQSSSLATNKEISNAPNQVPVTDAISKGKVLRRNPQLSKSAIFKAGYRCEFDGNHTTFPNSFKVQYMEGHHLIPATLDNAKSIWSRFNKNIDCVENIVSLCPNCHRAIHYSDADVKRRMLEILFLKREEELNRIGIPITIKEILSLYSIGD